MVVTSLLAFFVLICVLVFVHEYGHFWAARRCGVKVQRFSIGFGKVLLRKKDKHGTEFAFSLIPLGGYVQMYNGEPGGQAKASEALKNKSVLQRAFIVIAGPAANFIFAVLAYWLVFMVGMPTVKPVVGEVQPQTIAAQAGLSPELEIKTVAGQAVQDWEEVTLALIGKVGNRNVQVEANHIDENIAQTFQLDLSAWSVDSTKENPIITLGIRPKSSLVEPIIQNVVEHSAADKAGIKSGDKILTVNGMPFDWQLLVEKVRLGEMLELKIERADRVSLFQLQPEKSEKEGRYLIGIQPQFQPLADKYRTELKYDILTAFEKAVSKVISLVKSICQFVANLISGDISVKNMGGPISIAKGAGTTAEIGLVYYLGFMALISVNLGVMNLFPILPLDGGQLVLLAGEAIKKKPLNENVQLKFQQVGIFFVLCLMMFVLFNDLIHF